MRVVGTSVAYRIAVAVGAVICVGLCATARRHLGPWTGYARRGLAIVLAADAVVCWGPTARRRLVGADLAAPDVVRHGADRRHCRVLAAAVVSAR